MYPLTHNLPSDGVYLHYASNMRALSLGTERQSVWKLSRSSPHVCTSSILQCRECHPSPTLFSLENDVTIFGRYTG